MREPPFWWRAAGIETLLLAPAAAIYGAIAAGRLARKGERAAVPIVCIGNPTVGGAGKTPVALATARLLQAAGELPVFLSRGYGGRLAGPVQVEPDWHLASAVGDEPLLLARVAPTVVARDRVAGAAAAVAAGATVIVMDDGFQNPSLEKDIAILVVDAGRGVGNGEVLPAGPLRAPLAAQLPRAQALVVVGEGGAAHSVVDAATAAGLRVFAARLVPDPQAVAALKGSRVLAFAGIGDPEKFFATLRRSGIELAAARSFADHYRYRPGEAEALCRAADRDGLVLVTTEKDLARLRGEEACAELAKRVRTLPVTLAFDDETAFRDFVLGRLKAARSR